VRLSIISISVQKICTAISETVVVDDAYITHQILWGKIFLPFLYLFHVLISFPFFSISSPSMCILSSFPSSFLSPSHPPSLPVLQLKTLPYLCPSIPLSILYLHLLPSFLLYSFPIQFFGLSYCHSSQLSSNRRRLGFPSS
jgi:hypothetical protein